MKLERLVLVVVVRREDIREEDIGALAAEFERDRDEVLRRVLHDQAPSGGFAGEGDLADARARRERLACLDAEPVDDVQHTRGQQIADDRDQVKDRRRRLLGRLEHDRVTGGQGGGELPHGHEDREVPRNDLADDTERLVEMVGDGVGVDLRERTLLRANGTCEVAEVVDRKRDVGVEGFTDRLAVVPRLGERDRFEVLLDAVGDLVEDHGALGGRGLAPRRRGSVGGIECELDVLFGTAGDLGEHLPGHGSDVLEILPLHRCHPLTADPVVVPGLEGHEASGEPGRAYTVIVHLLLRRGSKLV